MYKKYYSKTRFKVKRPIRGFRDLEVYQRTNKSATEIMTKIIPALEGIDSPVKDKLIDSCLKIPELIASAHSRRFEKGDELEIMDRCMEECNKTVVYLEQTRDIFGDKMDRAVCEDLVKRYIYSRRKIFNLYRAWKGWKREERRSVDTDVAGEKQCKSAKAGRDREQSSGSISALGRLGRQR